MKKKLLSPFFIYIFQLQVVSLATEEKKLNNTVLSENTKSEVPIPPLTPMELQADC